MPDIAHIFYSLTFLRKKTFQRKIYSSEVSFESTQKVDIYWNMNQPTKMYTNHTEYIFNFFKFKGMKTFDIPQQIWSEKSNYFFFWPTASRSAIAFIPIYLDR